MERWKTGSLVCKAMCQPFITPTQMGEYSIDDCSIITLSLQTVNLHFNRCFIVVIWPPKNHPASIMRRLVCQRSIYCVQECSKKMGVKLILHARMPGWNRWWGGWLNSLAICVWCSSVVVILFGIVGFGDLGWYLTCPVAEFPDLHVERWILAEILVLNHPNNVELYPPGCGQFLQPLDIGLQ